MINNFHKIELDILQSFYNLRKKALKDPNNQDAIRHEWIKNNIQEKLILKTVSKPKFLKRLFYLVIDENFWLEEDRSKLELEEGDRRFFIQLIYLFNGLNPQHYLLDDLIENYRKKIMLKEFMLQDKKVNYKFNPETKDAFEKYRSCILSILKDAREYLESISVIWKWNEINNNNDSFNVHNFTLHGFHKIIKGKLQSTRNRWSKMTSDNKKEKKFINGNKIHTFLKPNNFYDDSKKISTLPTQIINKKLKEEGYATFNNWSHFADYTIAEEIISLRTSSKKDFNELINKIGFNSKKFKIILFGDYAHQEFLPIYKKKLERALPVYKNTPAGFLLDKDNFFWPDNSETKIYKSLCELSRYGNFVINKRFLDVRADIKKCGLEKYYSNSENIAYGPYSEKAFRNLYEENKHDFKNVLEEIDKIERELHNLDHLVISCRSRSKKLPHINNLVNITKNIIQSSDQADSTIVTCIIIDDFYSYEDEDENKEQNNKLIKQIESNCDSFIRFDREKFIEDREGDLEEVMFQMDRDIYYRNDIERMINDELIDIFNNFLVIYCNLGRKKVYRDFMQSGATIIGKLEVNLKEYKVMNVKEEIEKKYNYLVYDSHLQNGDYDRFGRLMITNSKEDVEDNIKNELSKMRIFQHETSEHLIENIVSMDQDDVFLTISFLQT